MSENQDNSTDVTSRVLAINVVKDSFVPEGSRDAITYYTLVLGVTLQGEEDVVNIKLTPTLAKLLKAADVN